MSKFSIRTNSLSSPATSFFDTSTTNEKFWQKKAKETDFADSPKIIENEFKIRKKTFLKDWDKCIISIRGSSLLFKKKKSDKNVETIDFNEIMYRLEIITPNHQIYSPKYCYGFSIYSSGKSVEFFCKDKVQFNSWITTLKRLCIMINFAEHYKVLGVLGSGGYGKVHVIENLHDGQKFAGKFIKISSTMSKERQKSMIINEIIMLRRLNHPQIVKLFEVFEMTGQVCLVMELVTGDKLFNYITGRKTLPESITAYILKQLLLILSYLQSQDVIHRDIKPENIIYTLDDQSKVQIKLIDFGLATLDKKRDMIKKCGTAGYVAPEVLNNETYNFKADLYSSGVILYICLTGRPLFYAKDYDELLAKNKSGIIKYKGSTWGKLSVEAQDLVQRILDPSPTLRISLADVLNHEWFTHNLPPEDRQDLLEYRFHVIKMNIPQEKTIARVPTSSGKIPFVPKAQALSIASISSNQKNVSGSFLTSNIIAGVSDHKELHPFYRIVSTDITDHSRLSTSSLINSSHSGLNSKNFPGMPVAVTPTKGNTLRLPTIAPNSPRRQNQPFRSSLRAIESEPHKFTAGYCIQVSVAESADDLKIGFEEEGSLCSTMYEDLKNNPLRFARILGRRPNQRYSTEVLTSSNKKPSKRCETEVETPRTKHKVVAVNSEVRRQITDSFSLMEGLNGE